jgi:tRNA 2-selenouridine synthase
LYKNIPIQQFVRPGNAFIFFDVRSPSEFNAGHFPGAFNLPLFNDEERAAVGTAYKQQGRDEAMLLGLELSGPRMKDMVEEALRLAPKKQVALYCWRGGMRSNSVAWLLDWFGFEVTLLQGGYKQFRQWVFQQFEVSRDLMILGGKTGSKKTELLSEIRRSGHQVVDLEGLAAHKGSAFGGIGQQESPTQEQFENTLAMELFQTDPGEKLWLEDESRLIGRKVIPHALWEQMRTAQVMFLDIPAADRAIYLANTYGLMDRELLTASILSIQKRLGGLDTRMAREALEEGNMILTAEILLRYYDKAYMHGLSKREPGTIITLWPSGFDPAQMAAEIIMATKGI